MARIITVSNQKGGVGKTTTTVNLADNMARKGKRTLIVDFDPQGQCSTALGIDPENNVFNLLVAGSSPGQWVRKTGRPDLHIIPGNRSTATAQIVMNAENRSVTAVQDALKPLYKDYDYIVFDTAPSAGGLQERAIWASNLVLLPTATEYLSSDGLMQIMELLKSLAQKGWKGKLAGILPTFYDEQTKESKTTLDGLGDFFGENVLDPIHRATILRECAAESMTIFEKAPKSRAAEEYAALTNYICSL
jgi:chromosome partitioning protein